MSAKKLKNYPSISLSPEALDGRVNFNSIFGRSAPVNIEVGTGKASFLLHQAMTEPHADFLGIEWARKYYRYAVDRLGRWNVKNVRIIRTDAAEFIKHHLPENSVDCFHIYFPDPWPKKKHHKRRLIKHENLRHIIRSLKTDGTIRIATDHPEYFQKIRQLLDTDQQLQKIPFTPTASADPGELVGTNYERKYLTGKRQIFALAVRKNP